MTTMPPLPDAPRSAPPHAAPPANPSFWKYIYNHNPFYIISALLMIYAVRTGYGKLEIGSINTAMMMGVLAAYTSLLAAIVVLIVRKGKVWEDARSILVLLLLLFLAVSVSADDLFNTTSSYASGTALMVGGFFFSAIVSEAVFKGTRIRLAWGYRLPYHLMLALFYFAPWWYAPEIHPRSPAVLEASLLAFPVLSAGLFLMLIPAVRGGAKYNARNGTPWPWPWFPGIGFGVIAAVTAFRSYALCMTFGPTGPIWKYNIKGGLLINFDTIWAPYFLVPLGLACLLLLVEIGVVTHNTRLLRGVMLAAPLLLILALMQTRGAVQQRFLSTVTAAVGSPVWLTVCSLIGFYALAWLRRLPLAGLGLTTAVLLLAVVGPESMNLRSLTPTQPWPFALIGAVLIGRGLWQRSSLWCSLGALAGAIGLWHFLPMTLAFEYRNLITYHSLWLAWVVIGFAFHDDFAFVLRAISAVVIPFAAMTAVTSAAPDVPLAWRAGYAGGAAAIALIVGAIFRDWWYLAASSAIGVVGATGGFWWLYRWAAASWSREAVAAFSWSIAALIIAFLISAHKANWFQTRSRRPLSEEISPPPSPN